MKKHESEGDYMLQCSVCGSGKNILEGDDWHQEVRFISSGLSDLRSAEAIQESFKRAAERQFTFKDASDLELQLQIDELIKKTSVKQKSVDYLQKEVLALERQSSLAASAANESTQHQKKAQDEQEAEHLILRELHRILHNDASILHHQRLLLVDRVFRMLPINIDNSVYAFKCRVSTVGLRGISTILRMPLPNNGVMSGVPIDVLAAALSYIAHLVDSIAAAMNIPLPHSIFPFAGADCLLHPQYNAQSSVSLRPAVYVGDRSGPHEFCWKTLRELQLEEQVDQHSSSSSVGESRAGDYVSNPSFLEAVTLLQADIISLCISMGMQPEQLWPPQALLLNLFDLHQHCLTSVKTNAIDCNVNNNSKLSQSKFMQQLRHELLTDKEYNPTRQPLHKEQVNESHPQRDLLDLLRVDESELSNLYDEVRELEVLKSLVDRYNSRAHCTQELNGRIVSLLRKQTFTSTAVVTGDIHRNAHLSSSAVEYIIQDRDDTHPSSPAYNSQQSHNLNDPRDRIGGNISSAFTSAGAIAGVLDDGREYISIEGSRENDGDEWDIVSICGSRML